MSLEDALEKRLEIINCTPADIQAFLRAHPAESRLVPVRLIAAVVVTQLLSVLGTTRLRAAWCRRVTDVLMALAVLWCPMLCCLTRIECMLCGAVRCC